VKCDLGLIRFVIFFQLAFYFFLNKTLHLYITGNVLHTSVPRIFTFCQNFHISATKAVNVIPVVLELECLVMDEVLHVCNNIL